MKYGADYFCTAVRPEKDGTFRWVLFGYFNGSSRSRLTIVSRTRYLTELEANEAVVRWTRANLPRAKIYGDAKRHVALSVDLLSVGWAAALVTPT